MAEPILDLNTLDRPVISIDKRDYPVMLREDFGLLDLLHIDRMAHIVNEVRGKAVDQVTEAEVERMGEALDHFVRLVMPDVPPEVFARLRDGQKLRIVEAFTRLGASVGTARPANP